MKATGDDPGGLLSFTMDIGGFMDTATIIEHLDAEISRLQLAKAVLTGSDVRKAPGRPIASDAISKPVAVKLTKRVMTAEGKKKIALAQKARWAKVRKEANVELATPVKAVKTATTVKAAKVTPPSKGSKKASVVKS
ncbi:MAG TPA: hypothetical protein VI386_33915 [Candidatus Sulfotelmatobacter sp.]